MIRRLQESIEKFELNLSNRNVLTEAATGNFVVTPVIAALAGASVFAFTKSSRYGSVADVVTETVKLARQAGVEKRIRIVESFDEVPFEKIDIVTNSGHLRPINSAMISKLSSHCVIPLMWEPWEYREADLDLDACLEKGIKVYGTNEEDPRLRTREYIGYLILYILLHNKFSPFSAKILLIGGEKFVLPVSSVLKNNNYSFDTLTGYDNFLISNVDDFNVIVLLEHERDALLMDAEGKLLGKHQVKKDSLVIHICGEVVFPNKNITYFPDMVRPFGYMSITPDFVDPKCVVDLHTAGLKVAEEMLNANDLGLSGMAYKQYLEQNYPASAFDDSKYW